MAVVVGAGGSAGARAAAGAVAAWCARAHPGLPLGALRPGAAPGELRCAPPARRPAAALELLAALGEEQLEAGAGGGLENLALLAAVAAWARQNRARGLHVFFVTDDGGEAEAPPAPGGAGGAAKAASDSGAGPVFRPGEEGLLVLHAIVCTKEGGAGGGGGGGLGGLRRLAAAMEGGFVELPGGGAGQVKLAEFLERRFPPFGLQVQLGSLKFCATIHPSPYLRGWRPARLGGVGGGGGDPESMVVLGFVEDKATWRHSHPVAGKVALRGGAEADSSAGAPPPEMLLLLHSLLGDGSSSRPSLLALVSFTKSGRGGTDGRCHGFVEAAGSPARPGRGRLVLGIFSGSGFEGLARGLEAFCPPPTLPSAEAPAKGPGTEAPAETDREPPLGKRKRPDGEVASESQAPENPAAARPAPEFFDLEEIELAWAELSGKLEELPEASPSDFRETFRCIWAGAGHLHFPELRQGLSDLLSGSAGKLERARVEAAQKLESLEMPKKKADAEGGPQAVKRSARQAAGALAKARREAEAALQAAGTGLEVLRELQSWLPGGPPAGAARGA